MSHCEATRLIPYEEGHYVKYIKNNSIYNYHCCAKRRLNVYCDNVRITQCICIIVYASL